MHLLPTCIGKLTSHADHRNSSRWSLDNIQIEVTGNRFSAVATDYKRLAVLEGDCIDQRLEDDVKFQYPTIPQIATAPNGGTKALIPADRLKDICSRAEKLTKRAARTKPILSALPIVIGERVTTFGASTGDDSFTQEVKNAGKVDGDKFIPARFPDFRSIIPNGSGRTVKVMIDPVYLAEMCELAKTYCDDSDSPRVTMEFTIEDGENAGKVVKPIVMKAQRTGLEFTGVIMPLS